MPELLQRFTLGFIGRQNSYIKSVSTVNIMASNYLVSENDAIYQLYERLKIDELQKLDIICQNCESVVKQILKYGFSEDSVKCEGPSSSPDASSLRLRISLREQFEQVLTSLELLQALNESVRLAVGPNLEKQLFKVSELAPRVAKHFLTAWKMMRDLEDIAILIRQISGFEDEVKALKEMMADTGALDSNFDLSWPAEYKADPEKESTQTVMQQPMSEGQLQLQHIDMEQSCDQGQSGKQQQGGEENRLAKLYNFFIKCMW